MASSGKLRRVALIITDVSEELSDPVIRVTGSLSSSETAVITRATQRNLPEDAVLQAKTSLAAAEVQSFKKIPRYIQRVRSAYDTKLSLILISVLFLISAI
jgi:hypothetical protein